MSEMADQQLKQMLLAYALLMIKDKPLKARGGGGRGPRTHGENAHPRRGQSLLVK